MRIIYEAPASCPERGAFERRFALHLGYERLARLDELARTLTVSIAPAADGFQARLALIASDGHVATRALSAPTCEQAMQAIALVAALAARSQAERIEREAILRRPAEVTSRAELPPVLGVEVTQGPERSAESSPLAPVHEKDARPALGAEVALGGSAMTGAAPGFAAGVALEARLSMLGARTSSLSLLATYNDTTRTEVDAVEVRLTLLKGRLELCPLELHLSRSLLFSPCAGFELGGHSGTAFEDGQRVMIAHAETRLWAAASAAARMRYRWGRLIFAAGPDLLIPVVRNEFVLIRPDTSLYQVPKAAVAFNALLGVALL